MNKKIYITCALPYINANPHLGHIFEFIQGDCFARFNRLMGSEVWFTAGTDENSLKNILASKENNMTISEWINQKSENFIGLGKKFNISFDDFIRTSSERHHMGAQRLWSLLNRNDLTKKKYTGLYCVGCECFYNENELVDGLCPEHKTKPTVVEEENYFFKLQNYKNILLEKIQNNELKISPETRKNEILSFLKGDVFDISVTRPKKRSEGVGIEIAEDKDQVLWVWIDALSNYINILDFQNENSEAFQKWWINSDERWHFLGKGILRFHAVFWPAFLLSAKQNLPTNVFCHGYVNLNNVKMSKSTGNGIDPEYLLAKYPVDSIRYYLMKDIPASDDGNFDELNLVQRHNSELCSGYGNLISRVFALGEKYEKPITLKDFDLQKEFDEALENYKLAFKEVKINDVITIIFNLVALVNRYISDEKPWSLIETDGNKFEKEIANCIWGIVYITTLLLPIMPETCQKVFDTLGVSIKTIFDIEKLKETEFNLKKGENLFERI